MKHSLAVTGGIGVGKTYVCRRLERLGVPVLSADTEARRLMTFDDRLRSSIERLIGEPIVDGEGRLQKPVIAGFIAREGAGRLNALVWPRVRRAVREWIDSRNEEVVAVECALLYEAGWERDFERIILIDAPREVRIARVVARDAKTPREVEQWMGRQLDEEEKRRRADVVLLNDGAADVDRQLQELIDGIL